MTARRWLALGLCLMAAGCGEEQLQVGWSEPTADVLTNGSVRLRVVVSGARPDVVQFLSDGQPFVNVDPPYEYLWDTTSIAEGKHLVTAKATRGGLTKTSDPRTVVVDRTPPVIVGRSPAPDSLEGSSVDPVVVSFSEDLDPSSLPAARGTFQLGNQTIGARVATGSTPREVTFSPEAPLADGARVQLALSGTVGDHAGNVLALDGAGWSFQVEGFTPLAEFPYPFYASKIVTVGSTGYLASYNELTRISPAGPQVTTVDRRLDRLSVSAGGTLHTLLSEVDGGTTASTVDPDSLDVTSTTEPFLRGSQQLVDLAKNAPAASPIAFRQAAGLPPTTWIHRWNGGGWEDVLAEQPGSIYDVVQAGDRLYSLGSLDAGSGRLDSQVREHGAQGSWTTLPGSDGFVSIIIQANGTLFAAVDANVPDAGWMTRVERLDAGHWERLGPPTPGSAMDLVIDGDGAPWLVVSVLAAPTEPTRRLTSTGWRTVGVPQPAGYFGRHLAAASDGRVWQIRPTDDGGTSVVIHGP